MVGIDEASKAEEGQVSDDEGVDNSRKVQAEHTRSQRMLGPRSSEPDDHKGVKHEQQQCEQRGKPRGSRHRDSESRSAVEVRDRRGRDASRSPTRREAERAPKRHRPDDGVAERDARQVDMRDRDRRHASDVGRDRHVASHRDRERDRERGREHGRRERDQDRSDRSRAAGRERGERPREHTLSADRPDPGRSARTHTRTAPHDDGKRRDAPGPRPTLNKSYEYDGHNTTPLSPSATQTKEPADTSDVPAAAPMSLEEVLKRKKQAEDEAAKPKFMSRKEREKLALQRNRQKGLAFTAQVDAARAALQQGSAPAPADASHGEHNGKHETKEHQKELAVIRQQYLGTQKTKRRVAKASDKFRFNFDWEASEDTHEARLHEGPVLFGRGTLAGIDRKAQREVAAKREQKLLSDMRRARGDRTTAADIQADMARANRASHIDDDPVLKEKHWSDKAREDMTARDWRIFREDHRISYKNAGQNAPMPFRNWDEMPLPAELRRAINDLGHAKPFPIQMASIPFGIRQRDVIGIAETGSGKTAAFVLPMLMYIMNQPVMTEAIAADGPYALILAPTRELAQQIEEETNSLAMHTAYRTVCIVGGASYDAQIGQLRRGAEIVVATPGRLGDCLRRTYAVLNQCAYVVLDEADRMIDLGFEPQVMDVLAAMPSSNMKPWEEEEEAAARGDADHVYRTTYMFSATMPPAVERIAKRYLRRPVTVTVGSAGRATDNVVQRVEWVEKKQKPAALTRALDTFQREVGVQAPSDNDGFKIIVFVNNRENSEEVYNNLQRVGLYRVALLHGGKSQELREECIKGFRDGEYDIMIATDVAGRGIDVKDVGLVINYDMPHTIEHYTHRIGRTGRAGRRGIASTFLTNADDKTFFDLKKLLEESKAAIPYQLANHEAAKIKPGQFESKKDTTLYAA